MDQNYHKNQDHYEALYAHYPVNNIIHWINNLESFLDTAISTEISWNGLYTDNLRNELGGKKVLELGCGDCVNSAVMAALGAEVYANDIAKASGKIVEKINNEVEFKYPIRFLEGDFLGNTLPSGQFDLVIGKAFLHHLTIPVEKEFLKKSSILLRPEGEARFFEPAVNNRFLDEVRWHIPVTGRPSKFQKDAFKKWKENDPHPDRSYSSEHWKWAGQEYFKEVQIIPNGMLERFSKLFPWGESRNRFKRWALAKERYLPSTLALSFARGQVIRYHKPILWNHGF